MVNGFQPFQKFGTSPDRGSARARILERQRQWQRMREAALARSVGQPSRETAGIGAFAATPGSPGYRPPVIPSGAAPPPEPPRWKPQFGGWFGSGVLENIAEGVGTGLQFAEPVLQPLHTAAKMGAGAAVGVGAALTSPLGPFATLPGVAQAAPHLGVAGRSVVPFLREFQEIQKKQYEKARAEGLDPARATLVSLERGLEEKQFPKFVQGALEIVFDPLNLATMGAGALVKKGAQVTIKRAGERIARETVEGLPKEGLRPTQFTKVDVPGATLLEPMPSRVREAGAKLGPSPEQLRKLLQERGESGWKRTMDVESITDIPILKEPRISNFQFLGVERGGLESEAILKKSSDPGFWEAVAMGEFPVLGGPLSSAARRINPSEWLKRTALGRISLVHAARSSRVEDIAEASVLHMRDPDFLKGAGLNTETGHISSRLVNPNAKVKVTDLDGKSIERSGTTHVLGFLEDAFAKDSKGRFFYGGDEGLLKSDPALAQQVMQAQQVHREAFTFAKFWGVEIEAISPDRLTGEGSRFIHRAIDWLGKTGVEDISKISNRAGKNTGKKLEPHPGAAKAREYGDAQSMVEGLAKGTPYMTNPADAAKVYVSQMLKASFDKQMVNALKAHVPDVKDVAKVADFLTSQKSYQSVRKAADDLLSPEKANNINKLIAGGNITSDFIEAARKGDLHSYADELQGISNKYGVAGVVVPGRKPMAGRTRALESAKKNLEKARKEADDLAKEAGEGADKEKSILRRDAEAEGRFINEPHLRDLLFDDPKEAHRIATQLGITDTGAFIRFAEESARVGDALRIMKTGFDFGAPFLQGLPALAEDLIKTPFGLVPVKLSLERGGVLGRQVKVAAIKKPWTKEYWQELPIASRWGKATVQHFKAFASKESHNYYLAQNREVIKEMVERGQVSLSGAASDYYTGMRNDALIPSALRQAERAGPVGRVAAAAGKDVITRFERSFNAFGDVIRTETWKAMRDTAAKNGDEGLAELGQFIRNSTGAFNSYSVGIPAAQQSIERGWLWFSPRYTRASLALIADAFQGGISGSQARKALASMLAVGAGMNYGISEALGREPNLDPTKGNFMTIEIGGQNVGPGAFFVSFLRLHAKIVKKGFTEPGDLLDPNTRDNPIAGWLRGRSAPGMGLAWDAAMRADFLGNKLETPGAWAKHLASASMPFALEAAIMGDETWVGKAAGFGPETAGGRVFPVADYEIRNDMRKELAFNNYDGKDWYDLNKLQQRQLELDNEALSNVTDAVRADRTARGEELDALTEEFYQVRDAAQAEWEKTAREGEAALQSGAATYDLPTFQRRIMKEATARKRHAMDALNSNPRFAPVRQYFTELAEGGLGHPEAPEDVAYGQFVTMITNPELEAGGIMDWERLDTEKAEFRDRWGEDVYDYIQARFAQGKDVPPLVQEYYDGKERFRYYWEDVEEQVLQSRQYDRPMMTDLYAKWKDFRNDDLGQEDFENANPSLKGFLKTIDRVRVALRRRDPELDAFMYRWNVGGISTLKSPRNRGREYDLRQPLAGISLMPGSRDLDEEA